MSAWYFARLGLFLSTGGLWYGKRLVSKMPGGVYSSPSDYYAIQSCRSKGWGKVNGKGGYFSWGQLCVSDNSADIPSGSQLAAWIVGPPDPVKVPVTVRTAPASGISNNFTAPGSYHFSQGTPKSHTNTRGPECMNFRSINYR